MNAMSEIILKSLLRRKSIQLTILLAIILIGVFSTMTYQSFQYLQAQNISQLSAFNEIIKPLAGLTFFTQIILSIVVGSQLLPYLFDRGQQGLVFHSTSTSIKLIVNWSKILFIFSSIPFLYFFIFSLCLYFYSHIDLGLIFSTTVGLFIGSFIFSSLVLLSSLFSKKTLTAFISGLIMIILVVTIDELLRRQLILVNFSIFLNLFLHLREGLVSPFEIIRAILWGVIFLSFASYRLQKIRLMNVKKALVTIISITIAIIAVGSFENLYQDQTSTSLRWDISRSKLNSLPDATAQEIANISQPISITAVIDDSANRDEIQRAFDTIHQYQTKATLNFTNRQAILKENNQADQFVRFKIGDKQQSIRYPFENNANKVFVRTVLQLASRNEQWITFIEGHGEASPFAKSNRDVSQFYQTLKALGWPIAVQNLQTQSVISDNTKIVIITSGKTNWLPSETTILLNYLKKGGNLLLLLEQEDFLPLEILDYLSLEKEKGTLIDWQGYQSGTPHPAIVIINQFTDHPLNKSINSLLAFPWAVGLKVKDNKIDNNSVYQTIIATHSGVWNEFNSNKSELSFNDEIGEQQKIFNLAISIEDQTKQQRIIIVGDSNFLSDSAINNYANKAFSINLINWLSSNNISSNQTEYSDNFIEINILSHFLLSWFFSAVVPLLLILFWFIALIRRKKLSNDHRVEQ